MEVSLLEELPRQGVSMHHACGVVARHGWVARVPCSAPWGTDTLVVKLWTGFKVLGTSLV